MHQTPLAKFHDRNGGKIVDFAGWAMPIVYQREWGGIHNEHHQVRTSGGIFDVSHMGRLRIGGRHSRRFLEKVFSRRVSDMQIGQCRYGLILNEQGGVKDDVIINKFDDDDYLMVVNAANREKIVAHFDEVIAANEYVLKMDDQTMKTAMVAIQGPKAMDVIGRFSKEIPTLKRYRFTQKNYLVMKLIVARTGYTGEDGIEVILPANMVDMGLKLVLKDIDVDAEDAEIRPAGLGARDTLRLEAGMPLYGNELGEEINAISANMPFALNIDKDQDERGEAYIGMEALKRVRDEGGPERLLVGIVLEGKRTARAHMGVLAAGETAGEVTSASLSPTLNKPIAMAYVDRAHSEPGTPIEIDCGKGRTIPGEVTALPFYKAGKK